MDEPKIIPFTTEEDRELKKKQYEKLGYILLETQYHFDGKNLIFATTRPVEPKTLGQRVAELEAKLKATRIS